MSLQALALALTCIALAPARTHAQCPNPDAFEQNDVCATSSVVVVDVLFADAGGDIIAQLLDGCHLTSHALDVSDTPDDNEHLTWVNDTDLVVDVVLEVVAFEPPLGPFCNDYELVFVGGAGSIGTVYCVGGASSANAGATASAVGSVSVSANALVLLAAPLPTGQVSAFCYGPETTQSPFGDGTLCVAPGALGLHRLPIVNSGPFGVLTTQVDFSQPPTAAAQIAAGSTWRFQAWFRDPAAGGAGFNLSSGLSIDFSP